MSRPFAVLMLLCLSASASAHAGPTILFIGDSHTVGTFGETLDTLLRAREGTTVKTVGSCGLSPNGFLAGLKTSCGLVTYGVDQQETRKGSAPTPTIDTLLAELRPTLTVIALGANQIETATSQPAKQAEFVAGLVAKVRASGSECLWVGPPNGRNKTEPKFSNLYRLLEDTVSGRCAFFDSRPERLPYLDYAAVAQKAGTQGDGRHYDALGAEGRTVLRRWALEVYREVERLTPP